MFNEFVHMHIYYELFILTIIIVIIIYSTQVRPKDTMIIILIMKTNLFL